jgi:signal transduction histidine kinase
VTGVLALLVAFGMVEPIQPAATPSKPETVAELLAASGAAAADDPERSGELAERALELARAAGDRLGEARALNRMGVAAYFRSDYGNALPLYAESLRIARLEGADNEIADALNNLGVLHYMWGSLDVALDYYRKALEIRRRQDDVEGLARAYNNLGGVADAAERYDEAVEYFSNALTLYQEVGDDGLAANTMNNLGQSLVQLGRLDDAHERFVSAHDIASRIGDDATLAVAEDNIGRVLLAQGQPTRAKESFERGFELKRRLGDRLGTATSLIHLSTVAAEVGDLTEAENDLQSALGVVLEVHVPQLERDIYKNLAYVQERQGNLEGAIDSLRRYQELHAAMISDAASRRLSEMQALLEVEKKNAEIASLTQARVAQRNRVVGLVGATLLLAIVVVLLWSRNRIQVRAAREIAGKNLELERAHEELERASRAEIAHLARVTSLGEMTAAVAHELNQPLAAILTNAQLLDGMIASDDRGGEDLDATISDITLGARRAWELLRNLRNLARHGDVERDRLDLREILDVAVDVARAEARLHGVSIDLDTSAGPLPVDGDPVLLQQVVLNLLQNAIAVMADVDDDKRPSKRVTVLGTLDGGRVRVSVTDAGPAVDDEVLANLFRPFFTTRDDGLGMGLAISKRLVEAHAGRIWARRAGERGLVVAFELPLSDDAPVARGSTVPD